MDKWDTANWLASRHVRRTPPGRTPSAQGDSRGVAYLKGLSRIHRDEMAETDEQRVRWIVKRHHFGGTFGRAIGERDEAFGDLSRRRVARSGAMDIMGEQRGRINEETG